MLESENAVLIRELQQVHVQPVTLQIPEEMEAEGGQWGAALQLQIPWEETEMPLRLPGA